MKDATHQNNTTEGIVDHLWSLQKQVDEGTDKNKESVNGFKEVLDLFKDHLLFKMAFIESQSMLVRQTIE